MDKNQIHDTEATHYVVDFYEVENPSLLDDLEFCANAVINASKVSGCGILNVFKHKFDPQGVSVNATLSESHCAIHTWPERGYCAIDLYGCGDSVLSKGVEYFKEQFKPKRAEIQMIKRGDKHEG
jgi:S-adenosylmethionine decarboxylase proenzyme